MSFITRFRQLPNADGATTEEGPAPDGPAERTPDDTAPGAGGTAAPETTPDQAADETPDEPAGQAPDEPAQEPAGETPDEPAQEPAGETPGEAADETAGQAPRKAAVQKPTGETPDEAAQEPADETPSETADEPAGQAPDEPAQEPADEPAGPAPDDPAEGPAGRGGGWRGRYPVAARNLATVTTVLAAALVLFALLMPNQISLLTLGRFIRIPAEAILISALLLALPPKPRRVLAVVSGVCLGLMTILNGLDMGFYSVLSRPFDPVLDWILFGDGEAFLKDSIGQAGAIGTVVGVVVLIVAVLLLMTLAVVRLSNLLVRHRATANRSTLVLGIIWITCSTLGVQLFDGMPIASRSATHHVQARADRVSATLADEKVFAKQAAVDKFRNTPADQLLTGLRGKDVIFAFIESYGRSAVEDPAMAPGVDAVLGKQTQVLKDAGFATRSGWLTSPVTGAGSWLAHTTFLSGLWVQNQQRYRNVTSSDRLTLTSAFKKTGAWQTVGMMPGVTRAWPEQKFFGLNTVYDSRNMGYQGPKFSWSPVPDQYTLKAFDRLAYGKKNRKAMMAEIVLATSHNPWSPLPTTIGWDQVGDGTVYKAQEKAGKDPKQVWKNPASVRQEYGKAIQYSVTNLTNFMAKYANKNTVLVFLGDHQPVTTVTGSANASRDVPVAIVAHDQSVLDKISDWGWTDSLQPDHDAPVWRMDTFRNRFLTAYGSTPSP